MTSRIPDLAGSRTVPEPVPFAEFVVKVHSRCDLACDYCYMYMPGDSSWRARPRVIPAEVVARTAERIAEHVHGHGLRGIGLVLHGGEPLLAGASVLRSVVESVRAAVGPGCTVDVSLQTNGLRIDAGFVELFLELGIGVSLSLDGAAADHDRHRADHRGRGSHARVVKALELLRGADAPGLFTGLLCVLDVAADPVRTLEALFAHDPPLVDLMLPHASWAAPPPRTAGSAAVYGHWLAAAFDHWYDTRPPGPTVRIFQEILVTLLGGPSTIETVGTSPAGVVVVETDGAIEQVDSLKAIYPGAAGTGLDVVHDSFDAALGHPGVLARQSGRAALADACVACALVESCGGGYYPHRYHPETGFRSPSVYCADLYHLITHIRDRVRHDLTVPAGACP